MGGSTSGVSNSPATKVRGQAAQLSDRSHETQTGPRLAARDPRTPRKPLLTTNRDSDLLLPGRVVAFLFENPARLARGRQRHTHPVLESSAAHAPPLLPVGRMYQGATPTRTIWCQTVKRTRVSAQVDPRPSLSRATSSSVLTTRSSSAPASSGSSLRRARPSAAMPPALAARKPREASSSFSTHANGGSLSSSAASWKISGCGFSCGRSRPHPLAPTGRAILARRARRLALILLARKHVQVDARQEDVCIPG